MFVKVNKGCLLVRRRGRPGSGMGRLYRALAQRKNRMHVRLEQVSGPSFYGSLFEFFKVIMGNIYGEEELEKRRVSRWGSGVVGAQRTRLRRVIWPCLPKASELNRTKQPQALQTCDSLGRIFCKSCGHCAGTRNPEHAIVWHQFNWLSWIVPSCAGTGRGDSLMSSLFKNLRIHQIFGANTDVGKTILTTALVRASALSNVPVHYLKPVSTGPLQDADDRSSPILISSSV